MNNSDGTRNPHSPAKPLIFERFLDSDRAPAPDIDLNFNSAIRRKSTKYAQRKYGHPSFLQRVLLRLARIKK